MRKNSYFLAAVFATAFVGEYVIDSGVDTAWRWKNRGVGTRLGFSA